MEENPIAVDDSFPPALDSGLGSCWLLLAPVLSNIFVWPSATRDLPCEAYTFLILPSLDL